MSIGANGSQLLLAFSNLNDTNCSLVQGGKERERGKEREIERTSERERDRETERDRERELDSEIKI